MGTPVAPMADPHPPSRGQSARFDPYPEYKDSGVEWLDEIPAHWNVARLKQVLSHNDGGVWGNEGDDNGTIVLRSTEQTVDGAWAIENPAVRELTRHEYTASRLIEGDLVITKSSGSARHIGKASLVSEEIESLDCCHSNFMQRLRVRPDEIVPRYLWYVLNSTLGRGQFDFLSASTTGLANLNGTIIGMVVVALPPLLEQLEVADFLDRETAKIDGLVTRQDRLIDLLQEKRTAIITRAVTRGIDLRVPMKDSGVEWLGDIPAHWEAKRTKFAARLRSGHTPSRQKAEYWQDCTIPWFGLTDVWQVRDGRVEYVHETAEKISEIGLANSAARLLPEGSVILSRTASVGFSAILGVDMATTQDFVNWTCGPSIRPEYLLYVFRAMEPEFRRLTMGSTHQTIYMHDVGGFLTPIPPVPEQDRIIAFIREETAFIDTLIARIHQAIDRLKEFRTTLISAAVTGKVDVREAAA